MVVKSRDLKFRELATLAGSLCWLSWCMKYHRAYRRYIADGGNQLRTENHHLVLLCCLFVAAFVGTTNWKRYRGSDMESDVFLCVPQNVTVDHHFPHDIGHFGVTQLPGCLEVYVRGKAIRWWLRLGAAWNQGCSKLIVCFEHLCVSCICSC